MIEKLIIKPCDECGLEIPVFDLRIRICKDCYLKYEEGLI